MKNKLSLKTAIITPVLLLIIIISSVFIISWRKDYDFLASRQTNKIINVLVKNTKINLSDFMSEASRLTKIAKEEIEYNKYYEVKNLEKIEKYLKRVMNVASEDPQISVIGYSDEFKNFVGLRKNYDGSNSLMLKDSRTDFKLNIYKESNMNSQILSSFEKYDPTIRPFYMPLKEKLTPIWTDIYVNYDEVMEATITNNRPIFKDKEFIGGILADVKLTGINNFLKGEKKSENSYIFILDKNNNLIAQSTDEKTIKVTKVDNEAPVGKLINVKESDNLILSKSYEYLIAKDKFDKMIKRKIDKENYYLLQSRWAEIKGLDWKIIVAIPESDLVGDLKARHNKFITYTIIFTILIFILLFYFLNKITYLILKNSEYASQIANGNLDISFDDKSVSIYEINRLQYSLKKMAINLKKSFLKIKRSESKYRLLVDNLDQMIFSIDKGGIILATNKSFQDAIKKSKEETVGINFNHILKDINNSDFWKDIINQVKIDKKLIKSMYVYRDKNDKKRVLDVSIIPLLDKNNEVEMILGSNTDMTELIAAQEKINQMSKNEKIRLEKEVEKRTKALEIAKNELLEQEKLASLGSLVSGVAHEINTPLGISVTSASYIKKINNELLEEIDSGKLSKEGFLRKIGKINETIETLDINLARASDLIKNFKKISINQSKGDEIDFKIIEYLDAVITSLKYEFKNTNYKIHIDCDKDLKVKSYPGVFSQIFTNFLMNSKIHGFKGLDEGDIYIDIKKEKNKLLIEYSDNGVGISEDDIKEIFDPFFTTNRENGGSGLGLSIVYNLVTGKLGGKIKCISSKETGTTFKIEINLDDETRK